MGTTNSQEKQSVYELHKKLIIDTAERFKKTNSKGGRGQTAENMLKHLEEYTYKSVMSVINTVADMAQRISDGVEPSLYNFNALLSLWPDVKDALYRRVEESKGTGRKIEEEIRQELFSVSGLTEKYRLYRYNELAAAEQKRNELRERMDFNDFNSRLAYINAQYDYLILKDYVEGCVPADDPYTEEYFEKLRHEDIGKLEEEFRTDKIVGKPKQ